MNEQDIIKILKSEFASVFTVVSASVNPAYPCYYVFFSANCAGEQLDRAIITTCRYAMKLVFGKLFIFKPVLVSGLQSGTFVLGELCADFEKSLSEMDSQSARMAIGAIAEKYIKAQRQIRRNIIEEL